MNKDVKRVDHDLSDLGTNVRDALSPGVEALSDGAVQIRKSLSAVLEVGKDTFGSVRDQTIIKAKAVDKTIRNNPYQSIGIAFGLGVLLTCLIRRK